MFYLTVHDIVWVNARLCGDGVPFDYERLEEGMAAQYGYGDSRDVAGQAAAFVETMLQRNPFREGTLRTGVLCVGMFLQGNGAQLHAELSTEQVQALHDLTLRVRDLQADGFELVETIAQLEGVPPEGGRPGQSIRSLFDATRPRLAMLLQSLEPVDGPLPDWKTSPYLHRD